jgi:DNA polymerase III delta prime subunit
MNIRSIKKIGTSNVFDLNVPSNHNFFVGESEILTSNCDRLTVDSQMALRNTMETFSEHTRFILTCNYVEKIMEPLVSRCQSFHIQPPDKATVAKHVAGILDNEGVSYEIDDFKILMKYYPDIRRIIQTAQQNSISGKLKITKKQIVESDVKIKLVEILKGRESGKDKLKMCRQMLADNNIGDRSDFTEYFDYLYENIDEFAPNAVANTIVAIADHQYKDAFVPNKEINFASCIVTILKGL